MASASHLLTAVDVAGQLQENIRISLIQVGYVKLRYIELVDVLIVCLWRQITTAE